MWLEHSQRQQMSQRQAEAKPRGTLWTTELVLMLQLLYPLHLMRECAKVADPPPVSPKPTHVNLPTKVALTSPIKNLK